MSRRSKKTSEYRLSEDVERALAVYTDDETGAPAPRSTGWLDPLGMDDTCDLNEQVEAKEAWGSGKPKKDERRSKYLLVDADSEEGNLVSELVTGFDRNVVQCEETVKEWKDYREKLRENVQSVHCEVDKRKALLYEMVDRWAKGMYDQLPKSIDISLNEVTSRTTQLKELTKEMHKAAEKYSKETKLKKCDPGVVLQKVQELQDRFEDICVAPRDRTPLELKCNELDLKSFENLCGELVGGILTAENTTEETTQEDLLAEVQLISSFSCQTRKDNRECGITDIAVLESGDFIVVDKHNKTVKMFDASGSFKCYIGRKMLKEPSRVCVLSRKNYVLVSDVAVKRVLVFQLENITYYGDFATDIKYPISVREMPNKSIAVLDYATRSVVVFDSFWHQTNAIETDLNCPAFMAVSKNTIIISDWKTNVLRVFNEQGAVLRDVWQLGSPEDQLKGPQGVCIDHISGNILVAEKTGRRIIVFSENGEFLKTYNSGLKMPWALASLDDGRVVVAEYNGNVKFLEYKTAPLRRESLRSVRVRTPQSQNGIMPA